MARSPRTSVWPSHVELGLQCLKEPRDRISVAMTQTAMRNSRGGALETESRVSQVQATDFAPSVSFTFCFCPQAAISRVSSLLHAASLILLARIIQVIQGPYFRFRYSISCLGSGLLGDGPEGTQQETQKPWGQFTLPKDRVCLILVFLFNFGEIHIAFNESFQNPQSCTTVIFI